MRVGAGWPLRSQPLVIAHAASWALGLGSWGVGVKDKYRVQSRRRDRTTLYRNIDPYPYDHTAMSCDECFYCPLRVIVAFAQRLGRVAVRDMVRGLMSTSGGDQGREPCHLARLSLAPRRSGGPTDLIRREFIIRPKP